MLRLLKGQVDRPIGAGGLLGLRCRLGGLVLPGKVIKDALKRSWVDV